MLVETRRVISLPGISIAQMPLALRPQPGQQFHITVDRQRRPLMTIQQQLEQAAEEMENRAENIANVTYTAPTETGEVETTLNEASQRRPLFAPPANNMPPVGRNDPCPCGSGKKYKQCHGKLS